MLWISNFYVKKAHAYQDGKINPATAKLLIDLATGKLSFSVSEFINGSIIFKCMSGYFKITCHIFSDSSEEIADGVKKSTQAVKAAEAGVRKIGSIAHQQTMCKLFIFGLYLQFFSSKRKK